MPRPMQELQFHDPDGQHWLNLAKLELEKGNMRYLYIVRDSSYLMIRTQRSTLKEEDPCTG